MALRRISRELRSIKAEPIPNVTAGPASDTNLYKWNAVFVAPSGTPYEGGKFRFEITFPVDYPFKPPKIQIQTKMWHPEVICPLMKLPFNDDILKDDWSPALSITVILKSAYLLFTEFNADDPLTPEPARMFKRDRAAFNAKAREWTRLYAMSEPPDEPDEDQKGS